MEQLTATVKAFKCLGLPLRAILDEPKIVNARYQKWEVRACSMQETGFRDVTYLLLKDYRKVMTMTVTDVVDKYGDVFVAHPLDNLCNMDVMPPNLQQIMSKYRDLRTVSLGTVRQAIMLEMLVLKLDCTRAELMDSLVDRLKHLEHRPLRWLAQTCDLLKNELGFTSQKILNNRYLLDTQPNHIIQFLTKYPTLREIDTRALIRTYPLLLSVANIERIVQIQSYLETEGITGHQVLKCGNVLAMDLNTVQARLRILRETPQLAAMKEEPRYLWLLYYLPKVLQRLSTLEMNNVEVAVDMLICSEGRFQLYILTDSERTHFLSFTAYLAKELGTQRSVVTKKLQTSAKSVISVNVEEVIQAMTLMKKSLSDSVIVDNLKQLVSSPLEIKEKIPQLKLKVNLTKNNGGVLEFKYGRPWTKKKNNVLPTLQDSESES